MVYTAESPSLALLEVLVHTERANLLPAYVLFPVDIPDELVLVLDETKLSDGWSDPIIPGTTKAIGDKWAQQGDSVALKVPSSIVLGWNYLLNPQHPDFRKVVIGKMQELPVDPRLKA